MLDDGRRVARFARRASFYAASEKARRSASTSSGTASTPRHRTATTKFAAASYAIAKSLAAAPYADVLWMETKTADLHDAKLFADAIHAEFPDRMLAYNLSPSFNWDTTGMSDDEMRRFPEELGKLGFVFNFITYGGHQIDGLAGEEFATALRQDGMLALARLQRKFRLVESPYRTPQTLVGGPRADAALWRLGPDGDDEGDGQRLDAVPASDPDRGAAEAARGVAGDSGQAPRRPATLRCRSGLTRAGSELLELGHLWPMATRRSRT